MLPATINYSKTHLTIDEDITYEEWKHAVDNFSKLGSCWQWWLGDLLNAGERLFGEKYTEAIETTGMTEQTLKNIAFVSRSFAPEKRFGELSWTHHAVVASESKTSQQKLLTTAKKKNLSVAKLKNVKDSLSKSTFESTFDVAPEENTEIPEMENPKVEDKKLSKDGLSVDLSDPTTAMNYRKMLESLDQMLKLRIPNMYLTGTIIEGMVIQVRDTLMRAGR